MAINIPCFKYRFHMLPANDIIAYNLSDVSRNQFKQEIILAWGELSSIAGEPELHCYIARNIFLFIVHSTSIRLSLSQ